MVVFGLIVVLLVPLLVGGGVLAFNGLVRRRARTREAWSQIDVELTRRHDLIPNLVRTAMGYAAHERSTLEAVTAARAAAVSAQGTAEPARVGAAENALTATLRSLFAVAENYPHLRAADTFLRLQEELTATEDKLEYARRYYNTSARDYDIAVQSLPRNLLAGRLGFTPVDFFTAPGPVQEVPTVDFGGSLPGPAGPLPPGLLAEPAAGGAGRAAGSSGGE